MLKRFAVLAGVAVILVAAVAFVACKYQASCSSNGDQGKDKTFSPAIVVNAPAQNQQSDEKSGKSSNCVPCGQKLLAWPEGITVWAVLLTMLVIGWQSWETSISAKAAKEAAEAALKQAAIQEVAQRAWLTISSVNRTEQGSMTYWWKVKNASDTPAKIVETQALCIVSGNGPCKLPPNPEFPSGTVQYQDRMLAPGDSIEFHTYWSGDDRMVLAGYEEVPKRVFMVAYGYVKYRTVLDKETHESRFCDYFESSRINAVAPGLAGKTRFRPKLDVPLSYTECT